MSSGERLFAVRDYKTQSPLDALIARRTAERRLLAELAASQAVTELRARGIDIRIFGSLARGDFMAHSDVDFIVHTPVTGTVRTAVETVVASAMKDTALPYDVFYLSDLAPDQAMAFVDG